MAALEEHEAVVREKIEKERWTHKQVSSFLTERYPGQMGLSIRSLQRFCSSKGIHKTSRIDNQKLDEVVSMATSMVSI